MKKALAVLGLVVLAGLSNAQTVGVHPSDVHPANLSHYGELYLDDDDGTGGTDITVTTAGTFYGWKSALAGHADGVVLDVDNATADRITISQAGDYMIMLSASFSGSNNALTQCSVFISGQRNAHIAFSRKLAASGDVGSAVAMGIDPLAAGDYLDLRCTSDSNSDVINLWNVNLHAQLIHD